MYHDAIREMHCYSFFITDNSSHMWFLFIISLIFFGSFFFNWMIIALQYCVGFCHTSTWVYHRYTYAPPSGVSPPPSTPSHLSLRYFITAVQAKTSSLNPIALLYPYNWGISGQNHFVKTRPLKQNSCVHSQSASSWQSWNLLPRFSDSEVPKFSTRLGSHFN